jgi:hypothetical protein
MDLIDVMTKFPHGHFIRINGIWSQICGWSLYPPMVHNGEPNPNIGTLHVNEPGRSEVQGFAIGGLLDYDVRELRPRPCPITEPVTLRLWEGSSVSPTPLWASWPGGAGRQLTGPGGVPCITLHPDGRYTWEGGPQ